MSYKAIVTKLRNVRPHPNADRVKLATCHGNQVVVGLDQEEGNLGVYFPCDGQLSHEFCHANNLYRDSAKNKFPDDKPGMFDDNRRVRAQKFRGSISDGFWCPMTNLSFIKGLKLDSLEEGFEFDILDGVPICNKYINPNTIKAAQQNQGKKTKTAKTSVMFKEHFDTEHFGKHLGEFKEDEILVLTEKIHGCVEKNTIIDTLHGPMTIGEIVEKKLSINIKAFDTITKEIVYVPIDDFYFLENDGYWYEIETEDGTVLTITGNNPIWLPELNCYRRVDELDGTEKLLLDI